MSLLSSMRFFYRGPGIALVLVGIIIAVGWVIKNGRDRADAEAAKHQTTRELGKVNPSESVDQSQAAKEAVLSNRRLSPGFTSAPDVSQIPNMPIAPQGRPAALPALVSFYAQVSSTPSPTPTPEQRPQVQEIWLPPSIFIPCALVNTVESSHINTPVVGEVIRDVFQNGHLIIPAGTIVSSFAHSGAVRDRIEVAGEWLLVFSDGRQLKISGIACDREADPSNQQFGIEDGSAGLQGELVESDHWANAKAFLALLISSTTQVATTAANGALSTSGIVGGGVALPDTSGIEAKYLDQLLNGETGDGRFVRVPASKEFYIFPAETVLPTHRSIENSASIGEPQAASPGAALDPMQMERELLRQSQPQPAPDEKFKY
jgi:type F conjugative transfer system protein TrbI